MLRLEEGRVRKLILAEGITVPLTVQKSDGALRQIKLVYVIVFRKRMVIG